ncbi:MAG TPA: PAS domain-containing protein, partial [Spirochaetia bacterium]|nr:PAS domain-containing protein [Spirochaetia bacterium]
MSVPAKKTAGLPAVSAGLLDAIDSAILLLSWDGTIIQSNDYARTMLGYADGLEGKGLAAFFLRQDLAGAFLERITTRIGEGGSPQGRTRLRQA